MSTVLIKKVKFLGPDHPFGQKEADWLIEDGLVKKVADNIDIQADKIIDGKGKYLSPGWIDFRAQFCDPGEEYKEDFQSGAKAAAEGGFTHVMVLPPKIGHADQKSSILYTKNISGSSGVDLLPYGNITVSAKGDQMAEMYDMSSNGAVAFTDDDAALNSGMLRRALLYAKDFDALVTTIPFDHDLVLQGQMHEGDISTKNGLRAWPVMAETLRIERDLNILRYTGGRLHFSLISSAEGLNLIQKAKKEGLQVTCDVAAHQLVYTDQMLEDFSTLYKVFPPLRSEEDRKALIEGVKNDTIDVICSDHQPQDTEHKEREFEHASFGMSTIDVVLPHLVKAGLDVTTIVQKLSEGPAKILKMERNFAEGQPANFTLFDVNSTYEKKTSQSKSTYNPLLKTEIKGKVHAVFNQSQHKIFVE